MQKVQRLGYRMKIGFRRNNLGTLESRKGESRNHRTHNHGRVIDEKGVRTKRKPDQGLNVFGHRGWQRSRNSKFPEAAVRAFRVPAETFWRDRSQLPRTRPMRHALSGSFGENAAPDEFYPTHTGKVLKLYIDRMIGSVATGKQSASETHVYRSAHGFSLEKLTCKR